MRLIGRYRCIRPIWVSLQVSLWCFPVGFQFANSSAASVDRQARFVSVYRYGEFAFSVARILLGLIATEGPA